MAWPTNGYTNYAYAVKVPMGPNAVLDGQEKYDEGYQAGLAAGGGSSPPTSGQIWPRGIAVPQSE